MRLRTGALLVRGSGVGTEDIRADQRSHRVLDAYRNAVDVARARGEADPEQAVLESYKSRSLMASVFAHKPTDVELAKLYGAMDETGQRAVREATTLLDGFSEMIEPNPIVQRIQAQQKAQIRAAQPMTVEQLRRKVASGAMGF